MADFNIAGRMKISTLKKNFKTSFGSTLRVYNGVKFAEDDDTVGKIAKETVQAEKELEKEIQEKSPKTALTELFIELKTEETPAVVERIVNDIDDIVRVVSFPGWQQSSAGEREVQQALRKSLLKYKLHKEQALFDRAYAYIKEYY